MMKFIDKFLKKLGTNRNTFVTYVLTLLTFYLAIDRLVEILLMLFTGVSYSYWNPIQYTLALACPVFAYLFSVPSDFSTSKAQKVTLFYVYIIGLSIIVTSMFTQWLNMGAWLLIISNPGYVDLVTDFSELIRPALTSITFLFPMFITIAIFKFLFFGVNDSLDMKRSIWDYEGIDLSDKKEGHGPYTNEIYMFYNSETGKHITMPESARYQPMLVCGGSGSGKTALIFEPMIAKDLERKYLFRETSKELGYTALKTRIAVLKAPYDNDYLNKNFNLNLLQPTYGKEDIYKAFMKKMILDSTSSEITYRNCGVTVLSPDKELSDHMIDVCKNFSLPYNVIDPNDSASVGLNPFVYDDCNKIAITISSILKSMLDFTPNDSTAFYNETVVTNAVEHVAVLLKEMYPRMNDGKLPNLEDMVKMFTNFELIEKMCEIMAKDEKLKEKHSTELAYCKKNFYKNGNGRENTAKLIDIAISLLNRLLSLPGVKTILCNRTNNLNFDELLANGEVTFICTRRGDLGATSSKAFGLFFLISMQNAVLRRPGNEKSRIPNFLYVDEFPDFICKATEPIFTMYRKYKIGTVISAQNLSQLDAIKTSRQTILSNCANKIFTGNASVEDLTFWNKEFAQHREWTYSNTIDFDKMKYDSKHGSVKWEFVDNFKIGKMQTFGLKDCAYEIRGSNGKPLYGQGKLSFMDSKYKEASKIKTYDFGKYSDSVTTATEDDNDLPRKQKFNPRKLDFMDDRNEVDPVQTNTTDSSYIFDNEDAIVVNLKNKKK